MLSIIAAGHITGTCSVQAGMSDLTHGDFITCVVVQLPTVVDMLRQNNPTWHIDLTNPSQCRQPLSLTYQVISGADGMIEFFERLVQASIITVAIDRDQSRIALTCLNRLPAKKGNKK